MIPTQLKQTGDPDLINSFAALQRAAQRAREVAAATGTMLVVWRDGECLRLHPDRMHDNINPALKNEVSKSGFGLLKSDRRAVPVDFDPAKLLEPEYETDLELSKREPR